MPQSIPTANPAEWLATPAPLTSHTWPPDTRPVVSICCITYNHKDFIVEAIEGFLMQETTFPVEIIINDDASTDGTSAIIQDYAIRYPRLIRAIIQIENQYAKRVPILNKLLLSANGKYIATCEGDDYWICNQKLQQQVTFLEQHPDVALCFHDAYSESTDPDTRVMERRQLFPTFPSGNLVFDDLAAGFTPPTAACVFLNQQHIFAPLVRNKLGFALTIYLALLAGGKTAVGLPDKMSVYRVHPGGIYSCVGYEKQLLMLNSALWDRRRYFSARRHRKIFTRRLIENYITLFRIQLRSGRFRQAATSAGIMLRLLFCPPNLYALKELAKRLVQKRLKFFQA